MRSRESLTGDRLREKDLMHYVDMDLGDGNAALHTAKHTWDFCSAGTDGKSGKLN